MQRLIEIFGAAGDFLLANITTLTGLVAALTGLVAAFASLYSARAAARSAKHAQEVERRELIREVIAVGQGVIAESQRIEDLGTKLAQGYMTLFSFAGGSGSSRLQAYQNDIENKKQEVAPLRQDAEKYVSDQKSLQKLQSEELIELLAKLTGYMMHARSIKEKFDYDLRDIEGRNAAFRERAINR